jgi:hypothetical protein
MKLTKKWAKKNISMSKRRKGEIGKGILVNGAVICIEVVAISLSLISGLADQGYGDNVNATVNATVNAPKYATGTFNASIDVSLITGFNSGQFDLTFNSSVVNVTDVKDGEINGEAVPIFMWNFLDADTIKVLVNMPMDMGVNGSGYLAEVEFEVKGRSGDKSNLNISGLLVDTEAKKIDADWLGSEVRIRQTVVSVEAPVYVAGTFNATVKIDNVTDFNTGQFDLSFNSSVVNVIDVKDGEIDGEAVPIFMWNFVDADTVKVLVNMPMSVGVNGSGYLAEVEFEVKGEEGEKSKLDISNELLMDTEAKEIDAGWINAEIRIGAVVE